jgi:ADP-heptose:LPS heptosyltransferase
MFRIVLWGGIGDALNILSTFPHRRIHETFGIKTTVFYIHWRLTGAHQYANPPGTEFFRSLVERFPSLRWGGEITSNRTPSAYAYRLVRRAIWLLNNREPYYWPLDPTLTPEESAALPDLSGRPAIAVQTHLLGVKTKHWGLENWQRYLAALSSRHPEARIVVIDPAGEAEELATDPNVITTRHLNLFQLLHLFRHFSLVVSVESWTKYAAAWNQIPQIIIVPDQRSELPIATAAAFLRYQLAGLYGKPLNRIIGLEKKAGGQGVLTLERISDLSVERLLEETDEHLRKFPLRQRP